MAINWAEFNQKVDLEGLKNDIQNAAESTPEYKEVPHGTYEVKVEKMELTLSKKGDPMVSIWFRILNGEYKNSIIFYNQVVVQGFQVHLANEFLRSLDSGIDVEFNDYEQYSNLLMDIHESINERLEYALEYGQGKNGFNTYKITEVFDVE